MADEATEQRTFAPWSPSNGVGRGFKPKGAFEAYQWKNGAIFPVDLQKRASQKFEDYATEWEKRFSLVIKAALGCRPVVDENLTIVGYVAVAHGKYQEWIAPMRGERGRVEEGKYVFNKDHWEPDEGQERTSEYSFEQVKGEGGQVVIYSDVPTLEALIASGTMFYDTKSPGDNWANWSPNFRPGFSSITYLCSIEGQILAHLGGESAAGAVSVDSPLDYISLAKSIVQLAAKGGAKVIPLLRNTAKSGSSGAASVKVSQALAGQSGWKNIGKLSAKEQELIDHIAKAKTVVVGRTGGNRTGTVYAALAKDGSTATVLDEWLTANGLKWSQRWQDVFNRALYERAKAGLPVNIMAGGQYTAGEAAAAEAGAAAANPRITNVPYWPNTK